MPDYVEHFRQACSRWLCEEYSAGVNFLALKCDEGYVLHSAQIVASPVKHTLPNVYIETEQLYAGHHNFQVDDLAQLQDLINQLLSGSVCGLRYPLCLSAPDGLNLYTDFKNADEWARTAQIEVLGEPAAQFSPLRESQIDDELRGNAIPFDGLDDLISWLGVSDPRQGDRISSLKVRLFPPVDLIIGQSKLSNGRFTAEIHSSRYFDPTRIKVGIRTWPQSTTDTRKQVAEKIVWTANDEIIKKGYIDLDVGTAYMLEAFLLADGQTVRRQFFTDRARAPNTRLAAVAFFDKELRRLQDGFASKDADEFEKAICMLAYLLGMAPAVLLETNAPDLLVSTPLGNLVAIECTTRIADFSTKLGKLVDRKLSLTNSLSESSNQTKVHGCLVCGLPRAQIVVNQAQLLQHDVMLLAKEDLDRLLSDANLHKDPDQLIEDALLAIRAATV